MIPSIDLPFKGLAHINKSMVSKLIEIIFIVMIVGSSVSCQQNTGELQNTEENTGRRIEALLFSTYLGGTKYALYGILCHAAQNSCMELNYLNVEESEKYTEEYKGIRNMLSSFHSKI